VSLFFDGGQAWRNLTKAEKEKSTTADYTVECLLRYAPTRVLLSGKIDKPEVIEGRAAWVTTNIGKGNVHLFGFSPHFRGWTQQTMHLLFRAIFLTP
jgi:hypothetical protein